MVDSFGFPTANQVVDDRDLDSEGGANREMSCSYGAGFLDAYAKSPLKKVRAYMIETKDGNWLSGTKINKKLADAAGEVQVQYTNVKEAVSTGYEAVNEAVVDSLNDAMKKTQTLATSAVAVIGEKYDEVGDKFKETKEEIKVQYGVARDSVANSVNDVAAKAQTIVSGILGYWETDSSRLGVEDVLKMEYLTSRHEISLGEYKEKKGFFHGFATCSACDEWVDSHYDAGYADGSKAAMGSYVMNVSVNDRDDEFISNESVRLVNVNQVGDEESDQIGDEMIGASTMDSSTEFNDVQVDGV